MAAMADATPVGRTPGCPWPVCASAAGRPGRASRREKARPPKRGKPLLAEECPAAREQPKKACIHCHQVNEFRRAQRQAAGVWKREELWVYPLPENVGLVLEVDRGDHVRSVAPGSAAAKIGMRAGDVVRSVNGVSVASQADFRYGLHRAPWKGKAALAWSRLGKELSGQLELAEGWKKTNITWRPSLLDVLPALTVYGDDLTPAEKKAQGLAPNRLAFRQDKNVHSLAKAAGVRAGDVIVGIDGKVLEMTMKQFLGHVRGNYLVGDRITLEVMSPWEAPEPAHDLEITRRERNASALPWPGAIYPGGGRRLPRRSSGPPTRSGRR